METGKVSQCEVVIEDHGILTVMLSFDLGNASQGPQGLELRMFGKDSIGLGAYIRTLMEFFGVDKFSNIKGKVCVINRKDGYRIISLSRLPHETAKTISV